MKRISPLHNISMKVLMCRLCVHSLTKIFKTSFGIGLTEYTHQCKRGSRDETNAYVPKNALDLLFVSIGQYVVIVALSVPIVGYWYTIRILYK